MGLKFYIKEDVKQLDLEMLQSWLFQLTPNIQENRIISSMGRAVAKG